MSLEVTFCGAARTVTGSQYYLQYTGPDGSKFSFCLDSGLFQTGQKINLFKINSHLLFDPRTLDAIILTHAHLDHCGRIPYLVKNGFGGKIYSTEATKKIAEVVMSDAARLHTENQKSDFSPLRGLKKSDLSSQVNKIEFDGEYLKHLSKIALESENLGLYSQEHVAKAMRRFKTYEYHKKFRIHPNLEIEFFDAGHILGSAYVTITEVSSNKQIIFSGDFGNYNKPIIRDPEVPKKLKNTTHVFIETTYGNRYHGKLNPKERLRKIISETVRQQGKVLLPSFSVERAQEVIYYIVELMQDNKLPKIPIFLDSPMASKILEICLGHPELYDDDLQDKISNSANPLIYKGIQILETSAQSKRLNQFQKPCIIVAGSGMLTGGRILKHLYFHLENPKNTLLMVGYQAVGTLGRLIWDGTKEVEVENKTLQVLTRVENINEFSAHADQKILKKWVVDIVNQADFETNTKAKLFLMHGEKEASLGFGKEIEASLPSQVESYWPKFGEKVTLWK
ncbi:MAG: MBL fold metallo-hydrolase [Patescibacteria group bacterium]